MLEPKASTTTFGDYAEVVFIPYLVNLLQTSEVRFGVVWDRYIEGSPRSSTREKCGSGSWIIVKNTIPKNWQSFLRLDENTTILQIAYRFNQPQVYCTRDTDVVSTSDSEIGAGIAPCNHKEYNTRLTIHALLCAKQAHRRILIRTVDTDVVVLSIAMFHDLHIDELWVALGSRSNIDISQYKRLQTN